MKLGRVGIDGTKVKANASKRKAMSYGRMHSEEARIASWDCRAAEAGEAKDRGENRQYGKDRCGDE